MTDTVNIGGVDIKVTDEPITEETVVVCVLKEGNTSPFDDNLEGTCSICQRAVVFRPYMKVATKMCMKCVGERFANPLQ